MRAWLRRLRRVWNGHPRTWKTTFRPTLECLEDRCLMAVGYVQTNLVSDLPGLAQVVDPNLKNPWGLVASPTSPIWVSDNAAGVSTLYNAQGQPFPVGSPLVVTIPPPAGSPPMTTAAPTGVVFNTAGAGFPVTGMSGSGSSLFLFATEDGTISGWNPKADATHAILKVDNSGTGAVYKGLALDITPSGNFLLAANFNSGNIDVFSSTFAPTHLAGSFTDPNLPAGFAPFNVTVLNGSVYVTYALQNAAKHDDMAGPGNGFVDVYDLNGNLVHRLASQGALNSPWGLALAPANFGLYSNDLLVGNFGDGHINAFDPNNGTFLGQLAGTNGQPIVIDKLWGLLFGKGSANSGHANTLFFTAGIHDEMDGLFGTLQATPALNLNGPILPNLPAGAFQSLATVPSNGDVNPYGVAFVPQDFQGAGQIHPGDILVANFNNMGNTQGTGTTIDRISPAGQLSTFFTSTLPGLSTALGVLKAGFVIVGNVPNDGMGGVLPGSLQILDSNGNVVQTLGAANGITEPWDLTVNDQGSQAQVFVSNVSGTTGANGTVVRIDLNFRGGAVTVQDAVQIGSGYATRLDPGAFVVGPGGLAYDPRTDTLYVASEVEKVGGKEVGTIFALAHAGTTLSDQGTGTVVDEDPTHLHGPIGLVLAPNGNLITANSDAVNTDPNQPSELVEFTPKGQFVGQFSVDPANGGAFGLNLSVSGGAFRLAAVDDNVPSLSVWTFGTQGQVVAAGNNGNVPIAFAIGSDGGLYRHDPTGWTKLSTTQVFTSVSAGHDAAGQEDAFAVGADDSLWKFDHQFGLFMADNPGQVASVSANADNWAIALTTDGSVFSYNGLGNGQGARFRITGAGFAQAVASVNDASGKLVVFAIGQADGALYRLDATPTKLSGTQVLQTLSAGVDGAGQADAFATGVDQSLFKFDSQNGFFQADGPGNALAVRAVGGNWAIVLTPDGSVFSYNGLGNGQGARFLIEGAGFGLGLDSVNLTSGDLVSDIVTTAHTVDQFDNGGLIALPGLTTL